MDLDNKRIVVVFLMHLGDVILSTPFVRALRNAAPNSHITYVMDEKLKDVMAYNPCIDEIVTIDKKGRDNHLEAIYCIGKRIGKGKPDVVINLHPNERASFLAWAIGGKEFVGMSHFLFRPFMDRYTRLDRVTRHAADMYVNVLEQLGIDHPEHQGLEVFGCEAWEEKVASFYESEGVKAEDKLIGFNIGSAVPQKRWPPEAFAEVAEYFREKGYKPVFFGGTMDIDMVKEARSHMKSDAIVATGKFSIGELAVAMKRCSLLITNDSGPMHVGVSQKVPIVALYGPSNPKYYGPYTTDAIVLESTQEYETKSMKKIIKEGKYKGISVITADSVIRSGEDLLAKHEEREF